MTQYLQGETAIISAEITNSAGTYINADTITCVIYDPAGTQKATGAMTTDGTGLYHYDYNLASDAAVGVWEGLVTAVLGARTTKEQVEFIVETR